MAQTARRARRHTRISDALLGRLRAVRRARFRPAALLVPVPEARPLLERAGVVSTTELPPHITLIYPFRPSSGTTPAVRAELRSVFAQFPSLSFQLSSVGRFPTALYLVLEPVEPFRMLIEALVARWPECPPYGGAFSDLVPHLTVVEGPEPEGLAARVAALLPVGAVAQEAWLVRPRRGGSWAVLERFALATPGPD